MYRRRRAAAAPAAVRSARGPRTRVGCRTPNRSRREVRCWLRSARSRTGRGQVRL